MDRQYGTRGVFTLLCLVSLINFAMVMSISSADLISNSGNSPVRDAVQQLSQLHSLTTEDWGISGETLQESISAINRLGIALDQSSLVSHESLIWLLVLSLVTSLISLVGVISPSHSLNPRNLFSSQRQIVEDSLEWEAIGRTIADIEEAIDQIRRTIHNAPQAGTNTQQNKEISNKALTVIESTLRQLKSLVNDIDETSDSFHEVDRLLQKLAALGGDYAHFASATRMEWNAMGNKLRQLSEHHDKSKFLSDKVVKMQVSTSEKITKTLEFSKQYNNHCDPIRSSLFGLLEQSKEGYRTLDQMSSSIGVSKNDVDQASGLVKGLSERAEAIVNIIDVIDDIAEQTNQLALNASIEAARAGEQGQGFAVVAGEVRNLAARSSTATRSITELLGTIQEEADKASRLLEKCNESVADATSHIGQVDRTYRESLTRSRQALSGLEGLTTSVSSHFSDLKSIERNCSETRKMSESIDSLLEEHGQMGVVINSEGNQLTVHSDRMSRLLLRQYHEVNHCQKLLANNLKFVEGIGVKVGESLSAIGKIRESVDSLVYTNQNEHAEGSSETLTLRCLQMLKNSSRTLTLLRDPAESFKEKTGQEPSSAIASLPEEHVTVGDQPEQEVS